MDSEVAQNRKCCTSVYDGTRDEEKLSVRGSKHQDIGGTY